MIADCQTIDQIQQRSTLRAYDTNSKLLHDEFYIPIQEYSDPLHYDKDYTYFMSQVQPGEYEFKKFSHSTMSATTIMSKIMLSAYQVFDICHVGSRLDYVVGLHMETNEVRVITLKESSSTYVKNVAKAVKHRELITQTISAKCSFSENFGGRGVYDIGVVGSFESDADVNSRDFYVSRFNTKGNFTTNFYESETASTSETTKTVYVDATNRVIYAVVDINTNTFYGKNVFYSGEVSETDNPNIAIVAFSFDFGTRLWVAVLGDKDNIDYFSGLSIYNGHLHVALTSHTNEYSTDEYQTDIIYTKIRADNGRIVNKKVFGSTSEDTALDIIATTTGIYIMATIGDNFLPHPTSGHIWQTNGGPGLSNFAILLVRDSDSQLVDIEGFDTATLTDPFPKRFSVHIGTGTREFIFYAPRSNSDKAGLYVTKFTDSSKIFINDNAGVCTDNTNCDRCNVNDPGMCMI